MSKHPTQFSGHTVKVIMLSEECHSVECQSAECRGATVEYGKSKIGINPIIFFCFIQHLVQGPVP
jgi:hypothetical protein